MKRSVIIALFAVIACGGTAFAQNAFEKSKKLSKEEVPVAVLQAFEKDFSNLQDKGFWTLYYIEKTAEGKTIFTPERYTFTGKNNGEKVILTYSANGTLESSKGVPEGPKN